MPEFLFVNADNKTCEGHKISTTGRAFVIRKARAAHPWSTKSHSNKAKRGELAEYHDATPSSTRTKNPGSKTHRSESARAGVGPVVMGEGAVVSQRAIRQSPSRNAAKCQCCNLPLSACVSASNLTSHSYLGGRLDPFGSVAVTLSSQDLNLITYCASHCVPFRQSPRSTYLLIIQQSTRLSPRVWHPPQDRTRSKSTG